MTTIRPADAADRHPLFTLIETIENFTPDEKEMAREVIYDGLASEENGYHILVAEDSEHSCSLCGFICYGAIPMTIRRWDLYWIAVAPELSRRGWAACLLGQWKRFLVKAPASI